MPGTAVSVVNYSRVRGDGHVSSMSTAPGEQGCDPNRKWREAAGERGQRALGFKGGAQTGGEFLMIDRASKADKSWLIERR